MVTVNPLGIAPSTDVPSSADGAQSATFGSLLDRGHASGSNNLFAQALAAATSASGGSGSPSQAAGPLGASGSSASGSASTSGADLISLLLSTVAAGGSPSLSAATASGTSGASGPAGPSGSSVVSLAEQFLGTPYVWGGSAPGGFDCSGLVQYVYAQLGVHLPRTSEEQATVGTPVSGLSAARPGDLLFFAGSDGTASAPGHVGIYIGNGQMIDAPYTGTDVRIESVPTGDVVDIRRVLPATAAAVAGPAPVAGPDGTVAMGNVAVPAQYAGTIEQAAATNGIPPSLLAALLKHESEFEPSVVSSAGAEGIAQFMPSTAAGMGVDPWDPTSAINGAARLLGNYTAQFGSYADALAAYSAGPSAVIRYGGIPPYAETQAYVPAVLAMAGLSDVAPAVA
jgi:peptidoglycan DL-endopeptidase CwlO